MEISFYVSWDNATRQSILMMICVFLEFIWKCFDKQVSVFYKRARPTGGQCGCFCSIRSPSMHLANPFTTCAIKSQPASVISFPTNFPARHFESILAFRYATHRRSSLDFFLLFFSRCEAPEREASRMNQRSSYRPEKKTSARLGSCMQMRTDEGTPEFHWEAFRCAFSRCGTRTCRYSIRIAGSVALWFPLEFSKTLLRLSKIFRRHIIKIDAIEQKWK